MPSLFPPAASGQLFRSDLLSRHGKLPCSATEDSTRLKKTDWHRLFFFFFKQYVVQSTVTSSPKKHSICPAP